MKRRTEQGAAQLLLVLTLVGLAALASAIGSRAVLTEMLSLRGAGLTRQARLAAQAALASAEAALLARYQAEADPLAALPSRACPSELPAPRWQCAQLPLPEPTLEQGPQRWALQAWLARDLLQSPHVLQLRASAQLAGSREDVPSGQALLRTSVFVPSLAPAPSTAPTLAVVLGETRPASGSPPCARSAWRQVLGEISPAQLRAWSEAQARAGLHAGSQPPRSIWWVDSPADWSTPVGHADQPALLVFSAQACAQRCPPIAAGTRIQGTVVLDADCVDSRVRGWRSGPIEGQLVVEADAPELAASLQVSARPGVREAYALVWPQGMDATRLQAMPGSRWEGP